MKNWMIIKNQEAIMHLLNDQRKTIFGLDVYLKVGLGFFAPYLPNLGKYKRCLEIRLKFIELQLEN